MRYTVLPLLVLVTIFFLWINTISAQEIGLQLYSLRNEFPKDVPGTFARIKSWGFTDLEDGNDGTYGYSQEVFNSMLAENGLNIVSVSGTFEELQNSPEEVAARAKNYGAGYAVCFWIPHDETGFTIDDANLAIEVFNEAGTLLNDEGITLVYHPHGYEFKSYGDALLMDYIIENSTYFDFEMDVYWFAHPGEDPRAWLKKYPTEFKLLHLKDCKKGTLGNKEGKSDVETNVVLGTGQIDIAGIVSEARNIGIQYIFIEDESSEALEQVPKSFDFLKKLHP